MFWLNKQLYLPNIPAASLWGRQDPSDRHWAHISHDDQGNKSFKPLPSLRLVSTLHPRHLILDKSGFLLLFQVSFEIFGQVSTSWHRNRLKKVPELPDKIIPATHHPNQQFFFWKLVFAQKKNFFKKLLKK